VNDNFDDRQVAIVTGATGAIGKAIARNLANTPGFEVVIVGRDETRTQKAAEEIRQATNNNRVSYRLADLAQQSSIKALAQQWQGPVHVLINNAAATPRKRQETPEGIECQFATNVLGYYWMMHYFEEQLANSAPARVINTASYWAGDLDLQDLEFKHRRYDNGHAYRQSKQANRMLTAAFAAQWKASGVTVNACHPGDVNSKLSNDLGFGGHESPDQGADTPVWLATNRIGQEETGKYFEHRRAVRDRFAVDVQAVEELYAICQTY
jgi:NAD(P)-dependent dehydrogenase (short-subunit alcohol dehydrogenase family)